MISLRKATYFDVDILYKWANDPVVRGNSFHPEPILYEAHCSWFNRILKDPSVCQFILMDKGVPVGQIRLNINGDEAEIGYSIAREFREKGYGHIILQLVANEVLTNLSYIKKLVAKVKPDNIPSIRLFESEGYDMKYLYYTLNVNGSEEQH